MRRRESIFNISTGKVFKLEQFVNSRKPDRANYAVRPQQFLYFFPLPQGHGSFRPTFGIERRTGRSMETSPAPSPSPVATPAIAPTGWGWRAREGAPPVGAVGACSRSKNCGNVARKFSKACKFDVLRKRLLSTSFLMFAIKSTNMSYA